MVHNRPLLTAIVPILDLDGDKENIKSWFKNVEDLPIEIILCYDSQLINAQDLLEDAFSELQNFNLKFISGNFKSPGMARNQGLQSSSGEWICFWDSDDMPNMNAFTDIIPINSDLEVVVGSYKVINDSISLYRNHIASPIEDESGILTLMLNPGIWRFCFLATKIDGLEFQNFLMAEDQLFLAELLLREPKIATRDAIVYSYRVGHSGRLTSNQHALMQLTNSMEYLRKLKGVQCRHQTRLINLILMRQFATYLRKLGPNYLWGQIIRNLIYFLVQPITTTRNILFIVRKRG
jgi:glycosyltransferase involved in cell wall biosynthesis